MRPREVSSLFLAPTLPCLLAPAGYASSLAAGFCAAFANPRGGLRPAASPLLASFIAGVAWASANTQAGNFSARMSTGWISGAPSSSSSARPSRAAATAP